MSRLAKSDEREVTLRYFVEEQMVATPAIVVGLAAFAIAGAGPTAREVSWGFTGIWSSGVAWQSLLVGLLSQGTGVFGALILLDRRESSFCVPVNRASSMIAGMLATAAMARITGAPGLSTSEMVGAGLVLGAITVLAWPTIAARRAASAVARPLTPRDRRGRSAPGLPHGE